MVTRRFIRISPEEKAALAAKVAAGSTSDEDKLHKTGNNADGTKNNTTEASKEIQLRQSNNNGGMNHGIDDGRKSEGAVKCHEIDNASKKRSLALEDSGDNGKKRPRKKGRIDLSDVPDQLPVLKSAGRKMGSSKYQGVIFHKATKKWWAQITIDGKQHSIGLYDNEEEAATDYARAVFKYRGGKSTVKRQWQQRPKLIDLSDVPEQLPILNRKDASSKYQGVTFHKAMKKWQAQINVDGKQHSIGFYDNEEEAAKDYARAVFKYRGGKSAVERQRQQELVIDFRDVPDQLPILSNRKNGSSKYEGVSFNKERKKWEVKIRIDGKLHYIGYYDNEEEAAKDYARAVYKYRGGEAAVEHQQKLIGTVTDGEII